MNDFQKWFLLITTVISGWIVYIGSFFAPVELPRGNIETDPAQLSRVQLQMIAEAARIEVEHEFNRRDLEELNRKLNLPAVAPVLPAVPASPRKPNGVTGNDANESKSSNSPSGNVPEK